MVYRGLTLGTQVLVLLGLAAALLLPRVVRGQSTASPSNNPPGRSAARNRGGLGLVTRQELLGKARYGTGQLDVLSPRFPPILLHRASGTRRSAPSTARRVEI